MYISEKIGQEYKSWSGNIGIWSGTGTGKSTFILNQLLSFAIENKKRILYLTNRDALRDQLRNKVDNKYNKYIAIHNYQEIEQMEIDNNGFINNICKDIDYIVMDESAYFFSDSTFNRRTDIIFNNIIHNSNTIKIFMTATPYYLKHYFDKENIKFNYEYNLPTDYSYIDNVVAYKDDGALNEILDAIPKDEKIIYFGTAKKALEISRQRKGSFICSKYNSYYSKYINKSELNSITNNEQFNNHLLCSTKALDNGISIHDIKVKHIIIEQVDYITFIQMLGRLRIQEGQKINLYFKNFHNSIINGFRTNVKNILNNADYLKIFGQEAYINNKEYKNDRFINNRIIDKLSIKGQTIYKINKCMYYKYKCDKFVFDSILDKNDPISYKSIIAAQLNMNITDIIDYEKGIKQMNLEEYLDKLVGKVMLTAQDRKELINTIKLTDNRGRIQKSIGQLNQYLKDNNYYYIINKFETMRIINGKRKKYKSAWKILRLVEK